MPTYFTPRHLSHLTCGCSTGFGTHNKSVAGHMLHSYKLTKQGVAKISARWGQTFRGPWSTHPKTEKSPDLTHYFFKGAHFNRIKYFFPQNKNPDLHGPKFSVDPMWPCSKTWKNSPDFTHYFLEGSDFPNIENIFDTKKIRHPQEGAWPPKSFFGYASVVKYREFYRWNWSRQSYISGRWFMLYLK